MRDVMAEELSGGLEEPCWSDGLLPRGERCQMNEQRWTGWVGGCQGRVEEKVKGGCGWLGGIWKGGQTGKGFNDGQRLSRTMKLHMQTDTKVHHPPLESSESHAGGAALKVCQRGEAPGPGLESPIATQSPRQRTSPVQEQNRGEGRRPLETHCPSTRCLKTTKILFHSETCVATVE
ncbi:hypothetical protein INR49_017104 [Caranx melampygus]|nr:hypothetical protein INR49_017104 [Caranx melampygus]